MEVQQTGRAQAGGPVAAAGRPRRGHTPPRRRLVVPALALVAAAGGPLAASAAASAPAAALDAGSTGSTVTSIAPVIATTVTTAPAPTSTAVTVPTLGSLTTTATSLVAGAGAGLTVPSVTLPGIGTTPQVSVTLPAPAPTLPSTSASGGGTTAAGAPAPAASMPASPAATGSPVPSPAACSGCAPTSDRGGNRVGAGGASGSGTPGRPAPGHLAVHSLGYAAHAGFPVALVLLGLLFLLLQDRIDRRDPRLGAAVRADRWLDFDRPVGIAAAGDTAATAPAAHLEDRLRSMQLARLAVAALALVLGLGLPAEGPGALRMVLSTVAYVALSAAAGRAWLAGRRRSLAPLGATFLLDGMFLWWMVLAAGGVGSALQYLVAVYVVTVTLLVAYRTGIKVAVWNSLLAVAAYYAQQAGLIGWAPPTGGFGGLTVFVAALYATAVLTATFAAANERDLRRRQLRLAVLHGAGVATEQAADEEAVARAALDAAVDGLGFRRGLVVTGPAAGRRVLAARGTPRGPAAPAARAAPAPDAPPAAGPATTLPAAPAERTPLLLGRLDGSPFADLAPLLPGAAGVVVLPLAVPDDPGAVMVVEQGPGGRRARVERDLVGATEQLASHAALAIGNRRLLERMQRLAATDGLTGLANRRTFDSTLAREIGRVRRGVGRVALILLDIDHFKRVNDTHGHAVGDEVLRRVAATAAAGVRPYDVVARYGGEELAVILPGCDRDEARDIAERLRAEVAALDVVPPVTVSAGVACRAGTGANATGGTADGDVADLIGAADAALYRAKSEGRNRVAVAALPVPVPSPVPSGPPASSSPVTSPPAVSAPAVPGPAAAAAGTGPTRHRTSRRAPRPASRPR